MPNVLIMSRCPSNLISQALAKYVMTARIVTGITGRKILPILWVSGTRLLSKLPKIIRKISSYINKVRVSACTHPSHSAGPLLSYPPSSPYLLPPFLHASSLPTANPSSPPRISPSHRLTPPLPCTGRSHQLLLAPARSQPYRRCPEVGCTTPDMVMLHRMSWQYATSI